MCSYHIHHVHIQSIADVKWFRVHSYSIPTDLFSNCSSLNAEFNLLVQILSLSTAKSLQTCNCGEYLVCSAFGTSNMKRAAYLDTSSDTV